MKVKLNCITQPSGVLVDGVIKPLTPEGYIIYAARLSSNDRLNNDTAPMLLKYLIDNKHWSPFEMISIGIEVTTSRAIAQQILRHKSCSFQEFSQRYAEVTEMEPVQLRYKADKNRQSSKKEVPCHDQLYRRVQYAIETCKSVYAELLKEGVATECARMILPLTTQTTVVIHGTLRSWIHFFDQRCDEHAQKEIQDIAYAARDLVSKECPWTAEALSWKPREEEGV